jgi:hypothetical protein
MLPGGGSYVDGGRRPVRRKGVAEFRERKRDRIEGRWRPNCRLEALGSARLPRRSGSAVAAFPLSDDLFELSEWRD